MRSFGVDGAEAEVVKVDAEVEVGFDVDVDVEDPQKLLSQLRSRQVHCDGSCEKRQKGSGFKLSTGSRLEALVGRRLTFLSHPLSDNDDHCESSRPSFKL